MGRKIIKVRQLIVCIILITSTTLQAGVVILKNGDIISGRLEETSQGSYRLHSNFGKLHIQKKNIEKIIWDESSLQIVKLTFQEKRMTGRLIRATKTESAYLLDDGRVIRQRSASAKGKGPLLFSGNAFLAPFGGMHSIQELYFSGARQPSMRQAQLVNTVGIEVGFILPIFRAMHLHLDGSYSYSKSAFASSAETTSVQSTTTSNRWAVGGSVRMYPFRTGSMSGLANGWYLAGHVGYQNTNGIIRIDSIEPFFFMDGRSVAGSAQSMYTGASTGLVMAISRNVGLDFSVRWELDLYQTLYEGATRSSVTGPERETEITGDGPLATQLREASEQESVNKDRMTDAFQSTVGYVHNISLRLGISYRFGY